jgi:hypothetical protein
VRRARDCAEATAIQHVVDEGLDEQLLPESIATTWCLAKLALELKSEQSVRAFGDIGRAMEAALEKAERHYRQTPKAGPALTHLNSLRQAIAGLGPNVATGCPESRPGGHTVKILIAEDDPTN